MLPTLSLAAGRSGLALYSGKIETEIVRKSIHVLLGVVPTLSALNRPVTASLLVCGILFYTYCETLRLRGYEVIVVSRVTALAARRRDSGRFVLGPVTLGTGAFLSLLLFPEPAASIAIYALAFGDGLSSLIGRLFGTIRIPFTGGKSLEGSLTCFLAVWASASSQMGDPAGALAVAAVAVVAEAVPTRDLDNLVLPVAVGLTVRLLYP
ncbi:MAG TPA: hypothetical protein VLH39_07990 [Magnetospirillaceae bacterium]|nr:hypothetical protein [Magnetospirillaceae bacterium]